MDTHTACARRTPAASDAITALISRINESKSNPHVAENGPDISYCRKAFQLKMLKFNVLLYSQIPPWGAIGVLTTAKPTSGDRLFIWQA
jgi:hypothetical protein